MINRNLNDLKRNGRYGLYKRSLTLSKGQYNLICDYLQKINYSLQDIDKCLNRTPDNTVLIDIVIFVTWIQEAVEEIKKSYKEYALESFHYNEEVLKTNTQYLKAIRSFVCAHPLTTSRHNHYGFDGTLRCVDIRPKGADVTCAFWKPGDVFYVDKQGFVPYNKQKVDYWLYIYNSKKDDNLFEQFVGISLESICNVANDYIDYLYAMDKHLCKIKVHKDLV